MKEYSRDKRSPIPSSSRASAVMSSIKAKHTKPEILLRKLLWERGLKGYRLHWKVDGRPDIAYPGKKVAIFVHGCYWHRCPICALPTPRSNSSFWQEKFDRNVSRDAHKKETLENAGWTVLVFWECQLQTNRQAIFRQIADAVGKRQIVDNF